jgi:hypothetical protein
MKKNMLKGLVMGATLAGFIVGGATVAMASPAPSTVKADEGAAPGGDKKDEKGKKGKKGDKKDEKKGEEKKE